MKTGTCTVPMTGSRPPFSARRRLLGSSPHRASLGARAGGHVDGLPIPVPVNRGADGETSTRNSVKDEQSATSGQKAVQRNGTGGRHLLSCRVITIAILLHSKPRLFAQGRPPAHHPDEKDTGYLESLSFRNLVLTGFAAKYAVWAVSAIVHSVLSCVKSRVILCSRPPEGWLDVADRAGTASILPATRCVEGHRSECVYRTVQQTGVRRVWATALKHVGPGVRGYCRGHGISPARRRDHRNAHRVTGPEQRRRHHGQRPNGNPCCQTSR